MESSKFKLVMKNKGSFTIEELRQEVRDETEVGIIFAQKELDFLKACSTGEFSDALLED